jgi:hypothetical protein
MITESVLYSFTFAKHHLPPPKHSLPKIVIHIVHIQKGNNMWYLPNIFGFFLESLMGLVFFEKAAVFFATAVLGITI